MFHAGKDENENHKKNKKDERNIHQNKLYAYK